MSIRTLFANINVIQNMETILQKKWTDYARNEKQLSQQEDYAHVQLTPVIQVETL